MRIQELSRLSRLLRPSLASLFILGSSLAFSSNAFAQYIYVYAGCDFYSIGDYRDSSPTAVMKQAFEPGVTIPACKPLVFSSCTPASPIPDVTCNKDSANPAPECTQFSSLAIASCGCPGFIYPEGPQNPPRCGYTISAFEGDPETNGPCPEDRCGKGNPVNIGVGNKYQQENDFVDPSGLLGFTRTYNSQGKAPWTRVGKKWHHNWDLDIKQHFDGAHVRRPDSKSFVFAPPASGTLWVGRPNAKLRLESMNPGWRVTSEDNTVELYDADGKLVSVKNAAGQLVTLTYSDGTASGPNGATFDGSSEALPKKFLIAVTDFRGRSIQFRYDFHLQIAKFIDTAGRIYEYTYGAMYTPAMGNLASVKYPDGRTRSYSYGEAAYIDGGGATFPNHLTGIMNRP